MSSSTNDNTAKLPFGVRVDTETGRYMSEDGSWIEPPLSNPTPSFMDHKHLDRVGIFKDMHPLGSFPPTHDRDVEKDTMPQRTLDVYNDAVDRARENGLGSESVNVQSASLQATLAPLHRPSSAASASLDDQSAHTTPYPSYSSANGLASTQVPHPSVDPVMHEPSTSVYPTTTSTTRDQPPIDPSLYMADDETPSPAVHSNQAAHQSAYQPQFSHSQLPPAYTSVNKFENAIVLANRKRPDLHVMITHLHSAGLKDSQLPALLEVSAQGVANEHARRALYKRTGRLKREVLTPEISPARSKASRSSRAVNITALASASPLPLKISPKRPNIVIKNGSAAADSSAAASPHTTDAGPAPKKIKLNLTAPTIARAPASPLKRAREADDTPTPSVQEAHGDSSPLSSVNEAIADQANPPAKKRNTRKTGRAGAKKAVKPAKKLETAPKPVLTIEEDMELDRQERELDVEVARRKQQCKDLRLDVERNLSSRDSSFRSSVPSQDTPLRDTGIPYYPQAGPYAQSRPGTSHEESKADVAALDELDHDSAMVDAPLESRAMKRMKSTPKTKVSQATPSGPKTIKLSSSSRPTRGSQRVQAQAAAEEASASATPVPSKTPGTAARGSRSSARATPRIEQQQQQQQHRQASLEEEDEVVSDHNDFCEVCRGDGFLVCCEHCDRSYHAACLSPPVKEDNLPDVFVCPDCSKKAKPAMAKSSALFGPLMQQLADRADQPDRDFELPDHLRDYFEGNATGNRGEYVEAMPGPAPSKRARTGGRRADEGAPLDALATHDRKGNAIRCYNCGGDTDNKRRHLLQCDYCSFAWHTDCLNPPRANPPPKKPWMCPMHIEHDLRSLSAQPVRRRAARPRRPRQATVADTNMPRGHRNNGLIEVADDPSDSGSDDGFLSEENDGEIPRLPAKGIKLDFIAKVKADRDVHQAAVFTEAANRRLAWEEAQATLQRRKLEQADAALRHAALQNESLARRSVAEGSAALSLLQFARDSPSARYHDDGLLNLVTTIQADALADPRFAPSDSASASNSTSDNSSSKRKRSSEEMSSEFRQLATLQALIAERQEFLRGEQDRARAVRSSRS